MEVQCENELQNKLAEFAKAVDPLASLYRTR
jgi:hypothetical protein